uniref:non-specific serine/threonine protein kinase n=1 Tax=Ananas comosus var. bracteatus TaxID=296719 RepID=A0A6V7NMY2_ANACO|nr:unnamed protein product [Ananas comosus var. bracteatus]
MLHAPPPPSLDLAELRALSVLGRGPRRRLPRPTHRRWGPARPQGHLPLLRRARQEPRRRRWRRRRLSPDLVRARRAPGAPPPAPAVPPRRRLHGADRRVRHRSVLRRRPELAPAAPDREDVLRRRHTVLRRGARPRAGAPPRTGDRVPRSQARERPHPGQRHLMLVDFDLSTKLPSPPPPPDRSKPLLLLLLLLRSPPPRARRRIRRIRRRRSAPSSVASPATRECPGGSVPSPSSSPSPAVAGEASGGGVAGEVAGEVELVRGDGGLRGAGDHQRKGHDFAVDWWAWGWCSTRCSTGAPLPGQNRKETFYRILSKDPELVGEQTPLRHLIARLLDKDPRNRIAPHAIKQHEFFRGVDWESLLTVARPPFIPTVTERHGECDAALDVERVVDEVFQSREAPRVVKRTRTTITATA